MKAYYKYQTKELETLEKKYDDQVSTSTKKIDELQEKLDKANELLEEKVYLFSLPESQVIDFAILSDVIKLQRRNYSSPERWWSRVVEDAQRIRSGYLQYSDDEIIKGGDRIHLNIA